LTKADMGAKLYQSESWLRKRYLLDKKTPQEIAKESGATAGKEQAYTRLRNSNDNTK